MEPRSGSGLQPTQKFSSRPDGQGGSGRSSSGSREITAIGILTALRRRWVPALAIGLPLAIIASLIVWETIPAKYESFALLKIQQFEQVLSFETKERHSEFLTYRDTQKAFLRSRGVITAALRNPDVVECQTLKNVDHPVDWLTQNLSIDEQISPEFLKVGLSGEHPRDLALIVNAVKDSYLDEVVYNERQERIDRLKKLEESFEEVNSRVERAQENIDQLARNLGTGDAKVAVLKQGLIQQKVMDLEKDLRDMNARLRAEEAVHQMLKDQGLPVDQATTDSLLGQNQLPLPADSMTGAMNPLTANLTRELVDIRYRIAEFQANLRDLNHPGLLELKRQEARILSLMTGAPAPGSGTGPNTMAAPVSRFELLKRQRDKLQEEVNAQMDLHTSIGQKVVQLESEQRKVQQDIKTRDDLATELSKRRVEMNAPERITVSQDAHVPEQREIKKKTQLSFLAGVAVLSSVVFGFTLFEWFSHRVGAATDVSGEVGLRVVGTVPSPDRGGLLGLGIFAGKVDYDEWNRAVIESMDVVRTFLMRHIDPSRPASILITSASANEGKTTVSCQLASSLARTGKRVALVDCDFRRPSAHLMVEGRQSPGLSEYLRGDVSFDDIRQTTQASGLTFISAGNVDQRVLQQLSVDGGRSLIQQLKSQFDFVIIDTSPLLFVAEPSMIAQNADIVLLATRKDYSRVPYVIQARDSLRSLQIPLLGAIMVGSDSDFQRQTYGYQQDVVRMASENRRS
ncbi:MAG: AAA family ATPase [Planctomyces sp.]|nr:AAA family ATPase [Planctomyces sp.]